jgi:hypothetical protein
MQGKEDRHSQFSQGLDYGPQGIRVTGYACPVNGDEREARRPFRTASQPEVADQNVASYITGGHDGSRYAFGP